MKKIVLVETCEDCKYFDNCGYDYRHYCRKLERQMTGSLGKIDEQFSWDIPEDCPLKDYKEDRS